MKELRIDQARIDADSAKSLVELCPFAAITYENTTLLIGAGCRMCGLCVKNGPHGAITLTEGSSARVDKSLWRGVAVYCEHRDGKLHNVAKELLGKARELAQTTGHPVYALLIGAGMAAVAEEIRRFGADKVFVYDHPALAGFDIERYSNIFSDFITKVKPSSVLVGATNAGRSLAPRVAARFRTGLTADCTVLQMKENTDLVQIRPAFGGNIMAQIVTPNHRPQFCTVRYKVFEEPAASEDFAGEIEAVQVTSGMLISSTTLISTEEKPRDIDISEAKVVVAVGRGLKTKADLSLAEELADALDARLACTRPVVEAGWLDAKRQIGLSGRTVNADLIIALGVSGSVQFAAGMKSSKCIVAVNTDPNAAIFDIAHYGFIGDLYEIVPALINDLKGARANV